MWDYINYLAGSKQTVATYTYGDSTWGDMLTNYNGTTISYDAIGNPTKWRNAVSLTWEGRELQRADLAVNVYVDYTYNSDGIRTSKSYTNALSGETRNHTYVLDGTRILSEKITGSLSYTLYYLYDESGNVQGFIYNNTHYYYQKNLQGDVVRILNSSGSVVVEYTYDAWGNIVSTTGSMASTLGQYNPFRYRSYYYDVETGFYYLQSRYYDPVVGRFLNADGIIGANGGIEGYNMFAYCNNNPVMYVDPSGECSISATIEVLEQVLQLMMMASGFYANGVPLYDSFYLASQVRSVRQQGNDDTLLVAYDFGSPDVSGETSTVYVDYSATMFVVNGYKITAQYECCTMPQFAAAYIHHDDLCAAVLKNGTYRFRYKGGKFDGTGGYHVTTYPDNEGTVPCVRWSMSQGKFVSDTADAIYIHRGGRTSTLPDSIWSKGCILINRIDSNNSNWYAFKDSLDITEGIFILYGPNRH